MRPRRILRWEWLIASVIVVAAVAAIAQTPSDYVYVLPKFSPDSTAELILSNLSPRLVTADITFYDPAGGASTVYAEVAANGQMRATPDNFAAYGARSFDGTVVVHASGPLSIEARIPLANGYKTLEPSNGGRNLTIPFSQGTLGSSEVSLFNDSTSNVSVVLIAVAANGTSIGQAQISVPGHGTRRDLLQSLIPAVLSSSNREGRDVSHVQVRVANTLFGSERRVYGLASVTQFADISEGIRQRFTDTAFVQAVPESAASVSSTVPLFVDGAGYSSLVQVINTSQLASNATLTARAQDGSLIGADNPVVVPLPAGGAIRRSVQTLFNLPTATTEIGSITVESSSPTITTSAIGASAGAFVVTASASLPSTNFAFATDAVNPNFYSGFTLINPGDTPATVTLRGILDDGSAVARNTQRIEPRSSITRNLNELLPEFRRAGFIHFSSDTPITVSGLLGRSDNTMLAALSPMHSQPDYNPPDPTTFVLRGVIRHNGMAFPGMVVQLSGPVNASAVTDGFGNYIFQDVPNGSYVVRAGAAGYSFSPSAIPVTIANDSSRGNDFAATLIVPSITFMQPKAVVTGSGATDLTVTGSPLTATTEILFEGRPLATLLTTTEIPISSVGPTGTPIVVSETFAAVKATLDAETLAVPRIGSLVIRTTGPGGSVSSAPVQLPIGSPAPVLTSISGIPQPLVAGNPGFTATVMGTGFTSGASVLIQGVPRPTIFVSSTTVQVRIPPEDLANGQLVKVTAMNPAPTIGPSNALDLPVMNPTPGLIYMTPSSAEVRLEPNAPPLQLTVSGFGFKEGAKIKVGSFEIPTTFIRSTLLIGEIPTTALQVGGAVPVVVSNPAPTVATSEALPFLLVNLPPILDTIDPGVLFFDSTRPNETFTAPIVMRGSNFGPNTVFELSPPCTPPSGDSGSSSGGIPGSASGSGSGSGSSSDSGSGTTAPKPATASSSLISSHEAILNAPIACIGTYQVRVRTPQPGGGVSDTLTFNVSEYSLPTAPVIASLSPNSVASKSASFTLTIGGSNFENGAVVSFGSAVLFPIKISPTSITVTVPSYLIARPDVIPVVVTNPSTAGSSNRLLFTIF